MSVETHEIGGEGPAAKAERIAKEKAAAEEQAKAESEAKAVSEEPPKSRKLSG